MANNSNSPKRSTIHFNLSRGAEAAEAWLIRDAERHLIYIPWHSLLIELDEVGSEEINAYVTNGNTQGRTLHELFSLIGKSPAPRERPRVVARFKPTLVSLGLTDMCNLGCVYCHSDARPTGRNSSLPLEVIEHALEFVAGNAAQLREKFEVSFTGPGEPTVAWSLLKAAAEHAYTLAKSLSVELDLSMATNGYYNEKKRAFLVSNFNGVSLSFDGIDIIQNLHRPTVNRRPTFPTVYETAKFFYKNLGKGKKGFRFAIRATVSQESLSRIDDIHEFFSREFPGISIGYEMLNPLGRGAQCNDGLVRYPDEKQFASALIKLRTQAETNKVINSGAGRIGELKRTFCKALAMPTLNITPQARVLACQRDGAPDFYEYGYYDFDAHKFVFDEQRIALFRSLTVDAYPECQDCVAKYHCAGDCHDLRRVGVTRCTVNKRLVIDNILSRANS